MEEKICLISVTVFVITLFINQIRPRDLLKEAYSIPTIGDAIFGVILVISAVCTVASGLISIWNYL